MTALLIRLLVLIAIFGSVFLISQLLVGSYVNRRAERATINRRLALMQSGLDQEAVTGALLKNAPPTLGPEATYFEQAWVGFVRTVMMSGIQAQSRSLAFGMGVSFCALLLLITFIAWILKFPITAGVVMLVASVSLAISVGLPLLYVSRKAQKHRQRMEEQFPLALDIFTRSLRAGHPIASAISLVTDEMSDPIGSEFGLVADEVAYGAELTDALLGMAERWDLDDMRMFVVSVSVQSETGGNLAEILQNLSNVIRARASLYMKVRALSSEGRMSAVMLTALPILTLVGLFAINPGFYLDVATDPIFVIGFPALLVLYALGVLIIRRIVDLKV
ncbi:type II secretion system F family protein [Novosphingobium ginsenosidimutans]|uniref:Type II secretion system F family protein n=1 Tax=Novosphingobium ginsenosidimutans TaxID=1176536 RepID=A0A5B8S2R6_9SPHN|nr:type II secretion system F family protein [Novosphingobium ginsenosidimutans]QEA15603.1 type II secretion system F family protein [Novosphingobium ginsenosidimutans]